MLAVIQFSDLRTVCGDRPGGGLGSDPSNNWRYATAQAFDEAIPLPDRIIVTGDLAGAGTAGEYSLLGKRLWELPVASNVLPGSGDVVAAAEAIVPSRWVSMNGAETHGEWLFIFVRTSSSAVGQFSGAEDYREAPGTGDGGFIAEPELGRIANVMKYSPARFVWLWADRVPDVTNPDGDRCMEQLGALVRHDRRVRGIGAGHVHDNATPCIGGVPVLVCPSMSFNVDVDTRSTLPPGYREYNFGEDGSVQSEAVWARHPGFRSECLPDPVERHLAGKISYHEMRSQLD